MPITGYTSFSLGLTSVSRIIPAHLWLLDDAHVSGTTVTDGPATPGADTGTAGSSVSSTDGPRSNTARHFLDDSNSYITLASAPIADLKNTDWSVAFWHRPNDVNHTPVLGATAAPTAFQFTDTNNWQFRVVRSNAGAVAPFDGLFIGTTDASQAYGRSSVFSNGNYTHVVVVWQGGSPTVYVNGSALASNAALAVFVSGTTNTIGSRSGGDRPIDGDLSEFVIYAVALSASNVLSLYQLGPGNF